MTNPSYFELFELEPAAVIDTKALRSSYRTLQTQYHPDKFASQDETVRLAAVQKAALINDAYTTLTDPVKRARYLLELLSQQTFVASNLASEPEFLMEQIEAREAIESFVDDGGSYDELMSLMDEYQSQLDHYLNVFSKAIDHKSWDEANIVIAKMQLFSKLLQEASDLEEQVD